MGLCWAYRSTSTTHARFAKAWRNIYRVKTTTALTLTTGPSGTFGGTYLDVNVAGSTAPQITCCGFHNTPIGTSAITVLFRIIPRISGNPSTKKSLLYFGNLASRSDAWCGGMGFNINSNGNFAMDGGTIGNGVNWGNNKEFGALTLTQDVPTDIWFVWDGSTASGAMKVYQAQNGNAPTLLGTGTASAARPSAEIGWAPEIQLNNNLPWGIAYNDQFHINEICIWDTAEDPTSYGARADFIPCEVFEGYTYTDPGSTNVLSGVGYTYNGSSKTGSLVVPSQSNTAYGVTFGAAGLTGTNRGYAFWESVSAAQLASGVSKLQDGVTVTGSLITGTDPATTDVRAGITWINGLGVTQTGSLQVPTAHTGTSGLVNFAQIKENIRYILAQANTTTCAFDLSGGLSGTKRVKRVASKHPGRIPFAPQEYPYVTLFVDSKDIEMDDIAKNQKNAKRKHIIRLKIVGGVVNNSVKENPTLDKADDDCERLMENIEEVLRRYPTLDGECLWHKTVGVTYHNRAFDEETHLRVGVLSLDIILMT